MKTYEEYLRDREKKAVALFASRVKTSLGSNMLNMRIFGSKVRGDFQRDSDIDILLVVRDRDASVRDNISEIASDLNLEFDCLLSPVIYTETEYNQNRNFNSLFADNLEKESITKNLLG